MALNSNFRTLTADNIEGLVDERNYLKSSFENGTTTGWTEMSVALTSGLPTGTPTISSSAAASLALSATSVTPLSGSRSLLVDVPSALTAGHGFISDEFTLDRMDLGKVLTVSFDCERVSGTYNFSGTIGSQTWMVYVYDATAGGATWIQPAGFLGMNQSSGPGRVRATFQSSVTAGQKYRVAVIASQAAAGASSIEFDNFTCSRQTAPIGPVVTDWVDRGAITITGSTSNPTKGATSVDKMWTRRVGDNLEVRVEYVQSATGTAGSGDYLISLPSGFSIDTNKVTADSAIEGGAGSFTQNNSVGLATIQNVNSAAVGSVFVHDATRLRIGLINSEATGNTNSVGVWASNYYALTTGDFALQTTFSVPISGWSSNVQLSNDTDTRVVDFRAYTTSARTVNNTTPTIIFENVDKDSHGAYNAATGVYTVPVSGDYVVSGQMRIGPLTMTSGAFFGFSVKVDGVYSVRNHYTAFRAVTTSSAGNYAEDSGSVLIPNLRAGQTLSVGAWGDNATSTFTDGANTFCIQRISGPSVVAANETVAMRAVKSTGSHTSNNVTQQIASWTSVPQDTHGIFNATTGLVTIPVSGTYLFNFQVCFVTNLTGSRVTQLYKNNIMEAESNIYLSFGDRPQMVGACLIKCNAGDQIYIAAYQNSGGNLAYSSFSTSATTFTAVRVGN